MEAYAGDNLVEINFLEGKGKDDRGHYINDLLNWGEFWMELRHDYIQRIFPLNESSMADPSAPVLSDYDVEYLKENEAAKENIRKMYQKMLVFYKLDDDRYKDWSIHRYWNVANNHNHLRMTRMLKCFKLLGMEDEYKDFSMRLSYPIDNKGHIDKEDPKNKLNASAETIGIWQEAFYSA